MKRLVSIILVILLMVTSVPIYFTASAVVDNSDVPREGSAALIRNGGYRPYLEWNSYKTFGLERHQTIYVYAQEGETVMFGSSVATGCLNSNNISRASVGVIMPNEAGEMNGDVVTTGSSAFGTVNYDFSNGYDRSKLYLYKAGGTAVDSVGFIANTTTEAIGPKYTHDGETYNDGGYNPYSFTVPQGCGGWWTFRFFSSQNTTVNPTPVKVDSKWNQASASIAAWDVTVEKTSGQLASGRMCASNLFLNMGLNMDGQDVLMSKVFALTYDGFLYSIDFNGMDPYGFVFFANNRGLLKVDDVDGEKHYQSLMHSIHSADNLLSDLKGMGYDPNITPATEDDETYLLFFNEPDDTVIQTVTGRDHLMSDDDLKFQSFSVEFEGNVEENVNPPETYYATEGLGGTFHVSSPMDSMATSYTVVIDLTGDPLLMDIYGYPADKENKVYLSNNIGPGQTSSVIWDGCDAFGNAIPASDDIYENDIKDVTIIAKNGEVHFPLFDVENNKNGIKIELLNKDLNNLYATPTTVHYNNDNSSLKYGSVKFADSKDMTTGVDTAVSGAAKYANKAGDQTALDFWSYYEVETAVTHTIDVHIIGKREESDTEKNAKLPDGTYHESGTFVDDGTILTYEFSIKNDDDSSYPYHNISYVDSNLGVNLRKDSIQLYDSSIYNVIPINISDVYAFVDKITYDANGNQVFTKMGGTHYFTSEQDLKDFLTLGSMDENGNYTELLRDTRITIGGFKRMVTRDELPFTNVITATFHYTDVTNAEVTINENAKHSAAARPISSEKHFVIDYGKPVTYSAENVFDGEGEQAVTSSVYLKRVKVEPVNSIGAYGIISVDSDTYAVTYQLKKIMNGSDSFDIKVTYRYSSGATANYIKKVTFIPATTMYYEDDFLSDSNNDHQAGFVYQGSSWTTIGTKSDYPFQRPDLNGDDNYGNDDSYKYDITYSNGTAHYTPTASVTGNMITCTFTFWGTGFEIYSRTDSYTGVVRSAVYRGATATGKVINYTIMDTLYKTGSLYQIPIIGVTDLDYGQYTVELQIRSGPEFIIGTGNRTDFYLDGLKVYYPIGINGEEDTNPNFDVYGQGVYHEDNENDSHIVSIRSTVLGATDASLVQNNESISEVYGSVYIDWGEYSADEETSFGKNTTVLADYETYGPKNELYILPGQTVAFKVGRGYNYTGVQLGAKAAGGSAASFSINNQDSFLLETATDMYYNITPDENGIIVIKNTSTPTAEEIAKKPDSGIVSLTKLKITGFSPIVETMNLVAVDSDTISAAQTCMMTFAPREMMTEWDSETVEPQETATLTVVTSNDVATLSFDGEKADCEKAENGNKVWTYETSYDEPGTYAVDLSAQDARGIESQQLKSTSIEVYAAPQETTVPTTEETTDETETTEIETTTEIQTDDESNVKLPSLNVFLRIFKAIQNFINSLVAFFKA